MHTDNPIDTVIALFLQGEASDAQVHELKQWIEANDENRRYFETCESAYYLAPSAHVAFDRGQAWQRVNDEINQRPAKLLFLFNWRTWAAALVLGLLGTWVWFELQPHSEMQWATQTEVMHQILPNGVELTLNKASDAVYDHNATSAWIALQGDAYFKVHGHGEKPFYVKTQEVVIRDIGTAFHVRNRKNEDTLFFQVDDGLIVCYAGANDSLRIAKGQRGFYCKSTADLALLPGHSNQGAFATKKLVFEEASMEQVIYDISQAYSSTILLSDPGMLECTISVSFDGQSLEEVLDIIAVTMNWELERSSNGWSFKGIACLHPF